MENAQFLPDKIDSAVNLPPNIFTSLSNWRLRDGVARRVRGYINPITQFLSNVQLRTLQDTPRFATNMNFSEEAEIVYLSNPAGGNTRFYKVNYDATAGLVDNAMSLGGNPTTFNNANPYQWSSFNWGSSTVFHNPDTAPMYATAGVSNTDFTSLNNWDTNDRTDMMFPLSNVMVGLGFHGATPGGQNIDSRRIVITSSQITSFNQLPQWQLGSDTNSASNFYLVDGIIDGDLITGGPLNNFAVAYSDVGSLRIDIDDSGRLTLDSLFDDVGVLGKNAWCQVPNEHFVIGQHQVYFHDGNNKRVVGQDQWTESLFARIQANRVDEVRPVYNPRTDSIWITIPVGATGREVWVLDRETNLIETVITGQDALNYFFYTSEGLPFADLTTTDTLPFDTNLELYSGTARAFRDRMIGMGGISGATSFFVHELGNDFGGTPISSSLRRDHFIGSDAYSLQVVNRITPIFSGVGNLTIRVGGVNNSASDMTFTNTRSLTAGVDTKMDTRITRRYLGIEFQTGDDITIAAYDADLAEKYRR